MSLFKAINFETSGETIPAASDNVDTTAELQIEQSYQIYDEIMHLYYSKLYKQAISKFNILFNMAIFKMDNESENLLEDIVDYMQLFDHTDSKSDNDEIDPKFYELGKTFISDNVFFDFYYRHEKLDHLRYLVFRNYSCCLYDYVNEQLKLNEDKCINWSNFMHISKVILVTSLKCLTFIDVVEPDIQFVAITLKLLKSFQSIKLTRNFIEFVVTNTHSLFPTKTRSKMLPKTLQIIETEINILKTLHINEKNLSPVMTSLIEKFELANGSMQLYTGLKIFDMITRYVKAFNGYTKSRNNNLEENIIVDYQDWNAFVDEVVDLTNQDNLSYVYGNENPDPYNAFEPYESITKLVFTINNDTFAEGPKQEVSQVPTTHENIYDVGKTIDVNVGFIGNITNKRNEKLADENTSESLVIKKRTSQRVKNLSEDNKREEESSTLQLKYLNFLEELCVTGVPKYISNSSMESFEYLKDSRFSDFQKCHSDVYDLFENWDKNMSDVFTDHNENFSIIDTNKTDKNGSQLLDIIINKLIENFQNKKSTEKMPSESLYQFLSSLKDIPKNHYFHVKCQIVEYLLCFSAFENESLITKYKWPSKLLSNFEFIFLSIHDYFLSNMDPNDAADYCKAICIYEYLVELYLQAQKRLTKSKQKTAEMINQITNLQDRIEAWNLNFFSVSVYFEEEKHQIPKEVVIKKAWSDIFYQKVAYNEYTNFGDDVNEIMALFEIMGNDFFIQNYNYKELPSINFSTLQLLKTKEIMSNEYNSSDSSLNKFLKVMINFEDVIKFGDQNSWEFILAKFIGNVNDPLVFNDILITILGNISGSSDVDFYTVDKIFKTVLSTIMRFLKSSDYNCNISRYDVLIDCFNKIFICLKTYTEFLNKEIELGIDAILKKVDLDETYGHVKDIVNLYTMIYSVVNYETICKNEQYGENKSFFKKAKVSAKKWKDLLAYISVIFCFEYQMLHISSSAGADVMVEEHYFAVNVMNNQHMLLAGMNICSSGNKVFLKYSQRYLMGLQSYTPAKDLLNQTLFCNYGLALNNYVVDHHTNDGTVNSNKSENIDIEDYLVMCNYVIKKYWNLEEGLLKKLFTNSNYKSEIEKMVLLIPWKHYTTHPVVQSNQKILDSYLSKDLLCSIFTEAAPLEIVATGTDYEKVVHTKVLLAASINFLELFFLRKAKELDITSLITGIHSSSFNTIDQIIELLKTNIIFNMSCYEAWYLLGYCYLILLDHDLNSSADKINSEQKKLLVCTNQKKAILCFLEALRILNKHPSDINGQSEDMVILHLSVANGLYEAYTLPMSRTVFKVEKHNVEKDYKEFYDEYPDGAFMLKEGILKMFITKTYDMGLSLLSKCTEDQNHTMKFFLTHAVCDYVEFTQSFHEKTNLQSFTFLSVVCDWSIESGKNLGYTFSHLYNNFYFNNTVLSKKNLNEAEHYNDFKDLQRLFSMLIDRYQSVHLKQNLNSLLNLERKNILDTDEFNKYISNACSSMIKKTKDKTLDSHQEQIVLSLMMFDMKDYKEILKTLWPMVSLSSPVKPLVNFNYFSIQKPGQSFIDMALIAEMFMCCLYNLDNLVAYPAMFKKLKRSSNKMHGNMKLYEKWLHQAIEKVHERYKDLSPFTEISSEQLLSLMEALKNTETLKIEDFNSTEAGSYAHKYTLLERYTDVLILNEIANEEIYTDAALLLFVHTILEPYSKNCDKPQYDQYTKEVSKSGVESNTARHKKDLVKSMNVILKKMESLVTSDLENVVDRFIYDTKVNG
ncbi:unnamed protein product [Hanseniaspora opuntiae]